MLMEKDVRGTGSRVQSLYIISTQPCENRLRTDPIDPKLSTDPTENTLPTDATDSKEPNERRETTEYIVRNPHTLLYSVLALRVSLGGSGTVYTFARRVAGACRTATCRACSLLKPSDDDGIYWYVY